MPQSLDRTHLSRGRRAPLRQYVGVSAAALVAFHGIVHELAGPLLFPWAPATFGALLWHGLGIAVLVLGALMWAGLAGLIRVPVQPISVVVAAMGLGAIGYIEWTHGVFHTFAAIIVASSLTAGGCHRSLTAPSFTPEG